MKSAIKEITGDDATMSLLCIGWKEFPEMKACFNDRLEFIQKNYIYPIERAGKQKQEGCIKNLWAIYKEGYDKTEEKTDASPAGEADKGTAPKPRDSDYDHYGKMETRSTPVNKEATAKYQKAQNNKSTPQAGITPIEKENHDNGILR